MIDKSTYEIMKKKYYNTSSWAVYAPQTSTPKSNIGNLSVFNDPNITDVLDTGYVFVGLNLGGNGGYGFNDDADPWRNFHSPASKDNDYKYRYLFEGTEFWGSYMTDIIKHISNSDGSEVMKYLKQHPNVIIENIQLFKEEISYLQKNPILVAMGDKSYSVLSQYLASEYKIVKIKHASFTISKENYRKESLEILRSVLPHVPHATPFTDKTMVDSSDITLDYFRPILENYPNLIFTNIDAKGKCERHTVWIYPKDRDRRHNVFIEVWQKKQDLFDIVLYKSMMTKEEKDYAALYDRRETRNRGCVRRRMTYREDLLDYLIPKLDMIESLK